MAKIEKKVGNIIVSFDEQWAGRIPPTEFYESLRREIHQLRVGGATTDEAVAAERFLTARYIKSLLEEFDA